MFMGMGGLVGRDLVSFQVSMIGLEDQLVRDPVSPKKTGSQAAKEPMPASSSMNDVSSGRFGLFANMGKMSRGGGSRPVEMRKRGQSGIYPDPD